MEYGKGAVPSVTGIAMLPFTGNNGALITIAAILIALGVSVFLVSFVLARKSRQANSN
jgi:uncharacterized membrane protein YtjA (UPF0391 family)